MDLSAFNATIKRWGIEARLLLKADAPTGTPDGTKFLRDDNVWAAASGGAAAAGTLTGATLAAGVTASSLLSAAGGSFGTAAFTASGAYLAAAGTAADVNVAGTAIAAALAGKQDDPTGTPTGSKFLRDDNTWAVVPGGSEAFPVGSVFIGVVSTNPNTLLGYGTWAGFGAGRVMVGLDSGDTDFDTAEETGGSKTTASTGTVAAPTISGSTAAEAAHTHGVTSNVTVADHASHTHTYTEVPNHTHPVNITDPGHVHAISAGTTDGAVARADASSSAQSGTFNSASATTGVTATTSNNTSGVATGTTAGPGATLTHTPTNNAVTSGAGSSHLHAAGTLAASAPAYTGNATSVVQPYIVCYFWKRTV